MHRWSLHISNSIKTKSSTLDLWLLQSQNFPSAAPLYILAFIFWPEPPTLWWPAPHDGHLVRCTASSEGETGTESRHANHVNNGRHVVCLGRWEVHADFERILLESQQLDSERNPRVWQTGGIILQRGHKVVVNIWSSFKNSHQKSDYTPNIWLTVCILTPVRWIKLWCDPVWPFIRQ